MRIFRFVFFFAIAATVGIALNSKIGAIPPLGKFLSPFHGFWQNAENEAISFPKQLTTKGLKEQVDVFYDDAYAPHIFAKNDLDLFYAQGYITAQHRLWQMEFQLLAADGRLSEILGERLLQYDRSRRRIGLGFGARNSMEFYKKEEPELYEIAEAYTSGVNDYINCLSYKQLPIEYKLLDYRPETWTPYKCFLFLSNMHASLSGGDEDLESTNALKLWGRELFDILYPETHPDVDPIIPKGTPYPFTANAIPSPDSTYVAGFTGPFIEKADKDNGSNNFVIGPSKTKNGNPIHTNEMDLQLTAPSIWYMIHLNSPSMNVMGVSFPGVPLVINGFNDSIAWGETNSRADLIDWYAIEFSDYTRKEYKYNGNWVPTRIEIEEFKVRGSDTFYDTIVYTHHGPVVYDRNFDRRGSEITNIAMKWVAHEPYKEFKAFLMAGQANNHEEFVEAFRNYAGPAQNVSFASASGDIALQIAGRFPIRWKEQGKFLMDGSNAEHEWKESIPYEHNPAILNPKRGFVSSANQHPVDSLYPYYLADAYYEYFRGRRLNDRLRVMDNVEIEDAMKLQHDNFNYLAFEALPMMLDSLDSISFTETEKSYFSMLKNWDYFNEPDREAPSLFKIWWNKLYDKAWDEIDSADVVLSKPDFYNTYYILRNYPNLPMLDDQRTTVTEAAGDLIRVTFKEVIEELEAGEDIDLVWYKYKGTTIRHLLRLDPFSIRDIKIGGDRGIVNAAGKYHGPSWRLVVELTPNGPEAWGIYPGSQSGNPGNPTYGHMIDAWANGSYRKLLFDRNLNSDSEGIVYSIEMQPTGEDE